MMNRTGILALLAALVLTACSGATEYTAGKLIDPKLLDTALAIGTSTEADVKKVLGEPTGNGEYMLPVVDPAPRDTLTYYFEEGSFGAGPNNKIDWKVGRIYLFVYFDRGRYDGYLWFSSLPGNKG